MRFSALLCVVLMYGTLVLAQNPAPVSTAAELKHLLDQQVPGWLKGFHVTSVSVAYIENGKTAWSAYYGDQVPGGPPANEKTLYNVASLTKPITAEVILRLASEQRLSLDEPIAPYWTDPDIKDNPWSKLLTPRICLSHQTGFTNWRYQTQGILTFQWEPGTKTGYSGEGFDYVARFAEKKTGQPWEKLAQHYVFDEIGMRDTSYTPRDWWAGRQAKPVEAADRTKWSAADLLRTTVTDYAKFIISTSVPPSPASASLWPAMTPRRRKRRQSAKTLQTPPTTLPQPDLVLAGRSSKSTTKRSWITAAPIATSRHALYLYRAARPELSSSPAVLTSTIKSSKKLLPCCTPTPSI
jgi:CubicO group peptidase (beta-lactamase class C family)